MGFFKGLLHPFVYLEAKSKEFEELGAKRLAMKWSGNLLGFLVILSFLVGMSVGDEYASAFGMSSDGLIISLMGCVFSLVIVASFWFWMALLSMISKLFGGEGNISNQFCTTVWSQLMMTVAMIPLLLVMLLLGLIHPLLVVVGYLPLIVLSFAYAIAPISASQKISGGKAFLTLLVYVIVWSIISALIGML